MAIDKGSLRAILALNGISGTCGLLVVLMVFGFARKQRAIVRRVSLRLQTGIAFIDFVKHFLFFLSYQGDDTQSCTILGFLTMVLEQMYLFLNVAIALNLHFVIINDYSPRPVWELFYWAVPLVAVLALNLPLLASGIFGKSNSGTCFIKNGVPLNDTLEMLYLNIPSVLTISYCLAIAMIVSVLLRKNSAILKKLPANMDPKLIAERDETISGIRSLVRRSTLYPAACFLSNIGTNFHIMYDFLNDQPHPALRVWAALGYSSTGILNLIAFLSDPLVQRNLRVLSPFAEKETLAATLCLANKSTYSLSSSTENGKAEEETEELLQGFIRYT